MRKDRITTGFLLLLLTVIIASSAARLTSLGQQPSTDVPAGVQERSLRKEMSAVKTRQEWDALLDRLPAADYDSPESGDPEMRDRRKAKNSHYDKRGMVVKNPDTSITLTEVFYEGKESLPLPTEESDAVVVGDILDRQSYLSNDKSGVYTEFTVGIREVLKGNPAQLTQGAKITASRTGGVVKYPNGHRRLYLVSGEGVPLDDGQYVLFLRRDEKDQTYSVLTMYEVRPDDVVPVDEGPQFEPYRGRRKSEFLRVIQGKFANASRPTP